MILDGIENCLMATRDDAQTINVICKKLIHRYEKIKSNKEEKSEEGKALGAYNKQYMQRRQKYGKNGHKPGEQKCPENLKELANVNVVWIQGSELRLLAEVASMHA